MQLDFIFSVSVKLNINCGVTAVCTHFTQLDRYIYYDANYIELLIFVPSIIEMKPWIPEPAKDNEDHMFLSARQEK